MAEELRWHLMATTVADGTTTENGAATFRNTTDKNLFVRNIDQELRLQAAEADEDAMMEVSKQATFQATTNGAVGFRQIVQTGMAESAAAEVDGQITAGKNKAYAKTQVILEPNEALFLNTLKSTGGSVRGEALIGYHF